MMLPRNQSSDEEKNILIKLEESIKNDEKNQFEMLIETYEVYVKHSACCINKNFHKELLCGSFKSSFKQENIYYREKLLELNNKYSLFEKESTELLRIAIQVNNVEVAQQFIKNGSDLADLDSLYCTPLEEAIRCKNFEMISMLLFYGGYTNNIENNLTSFMFSIICQCSEDIQRILMEYETDYNLTSNNDSILFMAIKYKSPLIFDLIERGADPSYTKTTYRGTIIALFVAIEFNCDMEILRKLWKLFDYNVWKECDLDTDPTSVLCRSLMFFSSGSKNISKYLEVFLENEEKLKLDIEHYECIQRESLILEFYSTCILKNIDQSLAQNCILHLLSYGAVIYFSDIDAFYALSSNKDTELFDVLLFMDLQKNISNSNNITFMYFRYTLVPHLQTFLTDLLKPFRIENYNHQNNIIDIKDAVKKLLPLFAFEYISKEVFEAIFDIFPEIFENVKCFPSLLQLSRDASRAALCEMYNIQRISQFYDMIKIINVPNFVKNLLIYKKNIYQTH